MKVNNLKNKYFKEIVPQMTKEFGYKSAMAVPKLTKIVVNAGLGPWMENNSAKEQIEKDFAQITGQKPVYTKARMAISGFKVREGQKVGLMVTLRGERMYDFLERLIVEALPRVRDFRGIPENSFGQGQVNVGLKEHIAFAEIDSERAEFNFSFQINIVNTAQSKKECIALMKGFGFPIRQAEEAGVVEELKSRQEIAKEKEAKEKEKERKKR